MTQSRASPLLYDKDGLPIYYTISHEKSGCKITMTARIPKPPTKKSPSPYGRIAFQCVHTIPTAAIPADIQAALAQHAPSFWASVFSPNRIHGGLQDQWVTASTPPDGLPLAIVAAIHQEALDVSFANSTKKSKQKLLNTLCASGARMVHMGTPDLGQFTAVLNDPTVSLSKREQGKAVLRWLCTLECAHGRLDTNPWDGVKSSAKPPKKPASLFNQTMRNNTYAQGEIDRILCFATEHLSPSPAESQYLALLLVTSMGIPLNEICCVTMAHIAWKGNTPFSISICKVLQKGQKNKKEKSYEPNNVKNRILPIPPYIARRLVPLMDAWRKTSGAKFDTQYLLPSSKNKFRHGDPQTLQVQINKMLLELVPFRPMYTGLGKPLTPSALLPPYSRLLATIKNALPYLGFEPDEVNYHFGYTQKTTAGQTYCDFGNDAELQRMAIILNSRVPPPTRQNLATFTANPPRYTTLVLDGHSRCPAGIFTLTIPPMRKELIPENGFAFALSADAGMSLQTNFIEHI